MIKPNILDWYSKLNTGFLHANGEQGTEQLLQQLSIKGREAILEYGFGTGATIVKLKSKYPELTLSGLDASRLMLRNAEQRLRFCGLGDQVHLFHTSERDKIGIETQDLVYVESVLAIQPSIAELKNISGPSCDPFLPKKRNI
ncbi:MAG: class I SAM-dependent methyltransferase [Bacteroidota bacterium]